MFVNPGYTLFMVANPLTQALKESGVQPIDLARQLRVSRQFISRAELGCPLNLQANIIKWIHSVLRNDREGLTPNDIQNWYHLFQHHKRLYNLQKFLLQNPTFPEEIKLPSRGVILENRGRISSMDKTRLSQIRQAYTQPPLNSFASAMGDMNKIPRQLNRSSLYPPVARIRSPRNAREAFINWRMKYWVTTYAFATDMCLSPGSVDRYETGESAGIPMDILIFLTWLDDALKVIHGE